MLIYEKERNGRMHQIAISVTVTFPKLIITCEQTPLYAVINIIIVFNILIKNVLTIFTSFHDKNKVNPMNE